MLVNILPFAKLGLTLSATTPNRTNIS